MSETSKVRPLIEEYLKDKKVILDIGCGMEKITPEAVGIDMRYPTVADLVINPADVYNLHKMSKLPGAEVVFSSHCLEHIGDWRKAIVSWAKCLNVVDVPTPPGSNIRTVKICGTLILYLPDDDHYDNNTNLEHVQVFKYETFIEELVWTLETAGVHFETIKHGTDYEGEGRYSFWVVCK